MRTIELMVYIIVALVVGGLFIMSLKSGYLEDIGEYMKNVLMPEKKFDFKKVNNNEFYKEVLDFWEKNKFSEKKDTHTVFLDEKGYMDKKVFFEFIKENNMCYSVQSRRFNCGNREDVVVGYFNLPSIVKLTYDNNTLFINSDQDISSKGAYYNSNYVFFAGFEGFGNITRKFQLPKSEILKVELEYLAGTDFFVFINNNKCHEKFSAIENLGRIDITNCSSYLKEDNNISIVFIPTFLERKYGIGGYLRIDLRLNETPQLYNYRFDLPEIDGSINYYDSFFIPGQISNINARLHYYVGDNPNSSEFYFSMADQELLKRVYSNENVDETISPSDIGQLSKKNVPFRLGFNIKQNFTKEFPIPIPVDAVLVTDVSGSMSCRMDLGEYQKQTNCLEFCCRNPMHPTECVTPGFKCEDYLGAGGQWLRGGTKLDCGIIDSIIKGNGPYEGTELNKLWLALCLGKDFIEIILDAFPENRIGLTAYSMALDEEHISLTSNENELKEELDSYMSHTATCISCGISDAITLLNNTNQSKAILIMSDGVANYCIPGVGCGEGPAKIEARKYADNARKENITLYSIGFGTKQDIDENTMKYIACGTADCSRYGRAENASELARLYKEFANQIANMVKVITKYSQGSGIDESFVPSKLYGDSYIQFQFTPEPLVGKSDISVSFEADISGCNGQFINPGFIPLYVKILSYSGVFWTDLVRLNNEVIFDLPSYGVTYYSLGDPFAIDLPTDKLIAGKNNIEIYLGNIYNKSNSCYLYNRLIYKGFLPQSEANFNNALGCNWFIEFEDGIKELIMPEYYYGVKNCYYTKEKIEYDANDMFQYTLHKLLEDLDENSDGIVDVKIENIMVSGKIP